MAYGSKYPRRIIGASFVTVMCLGSFEPSSAEDPECKTVKDCSEQMVTLAVRLKGENVQLTKQIIELRAALDAQNVALKKLFEQEITALKTKEDAIMPAGDAGKETKYCDKGTYMVGITFGDSSGVGPHGVIHTVQPVCRSM
ncbi:hypothetical protein MZK49_00615 [Ensifer sesbaniae]|uniref:hypothetical protein n=1 Tax=Ensifer sesbaniae TaxID=1214071 RepID=UPI0020013BDD|nr:hypothetical protein [Ensifer sesbaniae]